VRFSFRVALVLLQPDLGEEAGGFVRQPRLFLLHRIDLLHLALRFFVVVRLLPAEQAELRLRLFQVARAHGNPRARRRAHGFASEFPKTWREVIQKRLFVSVHAANHGTGHRPGGRLSGPGRGWTGSSDYSSFELRRAITER